MFYVLWITLVEDTASIISARASQVELVVKNLPTNAGEARDAGSGRWPGGGNGTYSTSSVVKNPPANARDAGSIPGSGRSPGGGIGNPL